MPVELVIDSLDGVDDALKGAYVEKEGKFNLDLDKYLEAGKSGLVKKNKELLGKLAEAKTAADRFKDLADLDDDQLAELLKGRGNGHGKGKADPDEVTRLTKKHQAEVATLKGQIEDAKKESRNFRLNIGIREHAKNAGVIAEDLDYVLFDAGKRFSLDDQGKLIVLDEDGDPTDMTPQKFFEFYRNQNPRRFAASGAGGGGAQPGTGAGNGSGKRTITREQWDAMDPNERATIDWSKTTRSF